LHSVSKQSGWRAALRATGSQKAKVCSQAPPAIDASTRRTSTAEAGSRLDPFEIAHRRAKRGIVKADSDITAARHRLADQGTDIGTQPGDHPWRRARLLLQQRQMGRERLGLGREAEGKQLGEHEPIDGRL
jgi:hypothetical protein